MMIHTNDIFDNEDVSDRWRYFAECHDIALSCGIICTAHLNDVPELEMQGSRIQMIKYYFKTLKLCDRKIRGVARLVSMLF